MLACGALDELRSDICSHSVLKIHARNMPKGLPFKMTGSNQYEAVVRSDEEIPGLVQKIVEGGGQIYKVMADKQTLEDIYFALTAKRKEGSL